MLDICIIILLLFWLSFPFSFAVWHCHLLIAIIHFNYTAMHYSVIVSEWIVDCKSTDWWDMHICCPGEYCNCIVPYHPQLLFSLMRKTRRNQHTPINWGMQTLGCFTNSLNNAHLFVQTLDLCCCLVLSLLTSFRNSLGLHIHYPFVSIL